MPSTVKFFLLLMFALITTASSYAAKKYERITLDDGKLLEMSVEPLGKKEGYLVLEITPDFEIKRIEVTKVKGLFPKFILKDVDEKSVHVVKLKAGDYYFSKIKLPNRMYFKLDTKFQFSVKAGEINYPGEFLMRRGDSFWTANLILKNRLFKFVDAYGKYLKSRYSEKRIIYNGSYIDDTTEEFSLCCD